MKDSLEINKAKHCRTCYSHACQTYTSYLHFGEIHEYRIFCNGTFPWLPFCWCQLCGHFRDQQGRTVAWIAVRYITSSVMTKGAAQLKLHYCIWTRSNVLYRQGLRQDYTKLVGCSAMHNPQDSPQCAVHSAARGLKGSDAQSTALLSERCQPCGCTQGCLHQLLLSESLRSIAVTYRSVAAKPRCWGPSLKRKSTKTIGWQQEGAAREDEGSKTSSTCHQIGQRKSQLLLQAESPTFKMVAVTQPASSAC